MNRLALLLSLLLALPAAAAPALSSEAGLAQPEHAAAIAAFWQAQGEEQGFVSARGGLALAARRFLQPGLPAAEQPALIIVSGRTEFLQKYQETVWDLWHQGYAVYLHDHRGQGSSAREPAVQDQPHKGHVERFDDYVADLDQFVRERVLAAGHRRLFLLAHSMGGAISARWLQSGSSALAPLRAAALASPMLAIEGLLPHFSADLLSCRLARFKAAHGRALDYVAFGGPYEVKPFAGNGYTHSEIRYARLLEQEAALPAVQLGSPTWGWTAQACAAAAAAREQAARLRTPLLLAVAEQDGIVHNGGAERLCASLHKLGRGCGGKGAAPLRVPAARHELLIESDAARLQLLQAVLAHFAAHGGR